MAVILFIWVGSWHSSALIYSIASQLTQWKNKHPYHGFKPLLYLAPHYISDLISSHSPPNSFYTSFTGLCCTKNTQSKLLDQVLGTFCCLCLKCSSFRYHFSGSETYFRSFLKCHLSERPVLLSWPPLLAFNTPETLGLLSPLHCFLAFSII